MHNHPSISQGKSHHDKDFEQNDIAILWMQRTLGIVNDRLASLFPFPLLTFHCLLPQTMQIKAVREKGGRLREKKKKEKEISKKEEGEGWRGKEIRWKELENGEEKGETGRGIFWCGKKVFHAVAVLYSNVHGS